MCMLYMFAMVFKSFQAFSQVFHTIVSSVSSIFFLYVVTIASGCFSSRSGVAHGMRVGSGWRCGPATVALALEPEH